MPRFTLTVVEPSALARMWLAPGDRCTIGSDPTNDLVLADPSVAPFHCELALGASGARAIDLGSAPGTVLDGVRIERAFLRDGSELLLGAVQLRFALLRAPAAASSPLASERTQLGPLVGKSAAMRQLFAVLERTAVHTTTVLLEGETGTGKSAAAEVLHRASSRRTKPFVVVDCGSIPENLIESELFGHERGAFTGAEQRRIGAFEAAHGGTLFLDEIGELPLALQPKLLRVLEQRRIKRVGATEELPVDVRLVAATHRDLRADTNAGTFRADLYFRLAVVRATVPALRERPEDIPLIAAELLARLGATEAQRESILTPARLAKLERGRWTGNVRELRNHLERMLVFHDPDQAAMSSPILPIGEAEPASHIDTSRDYASERERALARFERAYVEALLAQHGGSVAKAATTAGITRVHLYRLMNRHGLAREKV